MLGIQEKPNKLFFELCHGVTVYYEARISTLCQRLAACHENILFITFLFSYSPAKRITLLEDVTYMATIQRYYDLTCIALNI